jgi:hypothetical protein
MTFLTHPKGSAKSPTAVPPHPGESNLRYDPKECGDLSNWKYKRKLGNQEDVLVGAISVRKLNWRDWSKCAPTWERIHDINKDASFFLSREWVECWLATFGDELNPDLLEFVKGETVVGYCLLVWRTQLVRGIPLRRVYLNCSGENEVDSTCIDENSLLCLPDCMGLVDQALVNFLRTRNWDELILPGIVGDSCIPSAVSSLGRIEILESPSHYVDFCQLRSGAAHFDSVLSAKVRKKIRKSQCAYDRVGGTCELRVARSGEEAVQMLRTLANLHQARWTSRGYPGVFSSPKFVSFHEALIRRAFIAGRVLLFEVRSGPEIIGILYCFLDRGWVRFYQSGFNYALDPHQRPGFLTVYLSILYCLEQDAIMAFDFLAGDSQYKRSLANSSRLSRSIIVRRSTVPSLLFRGLRSVKRTYVQFLKKSRDNSQQPRRVGHPADISLPHV